MESKQPLDVVMAMDGRELQTVIDIWNHRQKMAEMRTAKR